MCYTVEAGTLKKLKYAKHRGDAYEASRLEEQLEKLTESMPPQFHINGFAHPKLLVFTDKDPFMSQAFQWGLIPSWVKDQAGAKTIANQTLNARSETMFEKASFKASANNKRCLIYIDAFYEYHHIGKKTFPFRVVMKDGEPMVLAGLWNTWIDKSTGEEISSVSIVTTIGNAPMALIHNNPKNEGARMPVILPKHTQDEWLVPVKTDLDKAKLMELVVPFQANEMNYYPVSKILGKEALGNVPEVEEMVEYDELVAMLIELKVLSK